MGVRVLPHPPPSPNSSIVLSHRPVAFWLWFSKRLAPQLLSSSLFLFLPPLLPPSPPPSPLQSSTPDPTPPLSNLSSLIASMAPVTMFNPMSKGGRGATTSIQPPPEAPCMQLARRCSRRLSSGRGSDYLCMGMVYNIVTGAKDAINERLYMIPSAHELRLGACRRRRMQCRLRCGAPTETGATVSANDGDGNFFHPS